MDRQTELRIQMHIEIHVDELLIKNSEMFVLKAPIVLISRGYRGSPVNPKLHPKPSTESSLRILLQDPALRFSVGRRWQTFGRKLMVLGFSI